jgi:hypothetical protein
MFKIHLIAQQLEALYEHLPTPADLEALNYCVAIPNLLESVNVSHRESLIVERLIDLQHLGNFAKLK